MTTVMEVKNAFAPASVKQKVSTSMEIDNIGEMQFSHQSDLKRE